MRLGWLRRDDRADAGPIPQQELREGGAKLPVGENCRELGGYALPSGRLTLMHRFLRSGTTADLSDREVDYLIGYGVRHVVDLRSKEEVRGEPDRLAERSEVSYANFPLYQKNLHDDSLALQADADDYLTNGYLGMLKNTEAVRGIFETMAAAEDDECVLFHCTAGMDRTGVVSMLLLGLAGIERETIIADYGYSFSSREDIDAYLSQGSKTAWDFIPTFCGLIGRVYDIACSSFGSVRGYLSACGIPDEALDRVARHLVGA
jgi:protein-tyrosine phosphatase